MRLAAILTAISLLGAACSGSAAPVDAPRYTADQVWAATRQFRQCFPEFVSYRGNGLWHCVYPWVFDERTGRLFEDFQRAE